MKKVIKNILISLIFALTFFAFSYFNVLPQVDLRLTDNLYSKLRTPSQDIVIIGIDENTLTEYGAFSTWSRNKVGDLINLLFADKNNHPAVVGVDILFQGDIDEEIDNKLANACKGRNVIVSSSIKFQGTVDIKTKSYDKYNIAYIERAYDSLYANSKNAYTNTLQSEDGANRYSAYYFDFNGERYNSLSYKIVEAYSEYKNIDIKPINCDDRGMFRFFYAGKPKEFSIKPLNKVLDGTIPVNEFKDKIVLVGACASAMQDEFYATADIPGTMYGVEIHANIIQSLLEGKTAVNYNNFYYSLILLCVAFIVCFISLTVDNFIISIVVPLLAAIIHVAVGRKLSNNGLIITQLYALSSFIILDVLYIVIRSLSELRKRQQITKVFSRYMDPKLVSKTVKDEQDTIVLNGEKRHVAILFVDIRGFTTLSEAMKPEDVVGILNDYLSHVTECIFKHNGLLDKFIGDAAMAIFNAPVDQDDYIYEAVATAYDIVKKSSDLKKNIFEKYGKDVNFGVGVHCGEAVIGNIGSKSRMDYTAIGDTVNTASRIEGKAKKGEVLISIDVKERVENRIRTKDAGFIELKGKAEPVHVYSLVLDEGEDTNE